MPKQEVLYTPVGKVKFPKTTINDKEYPYIFVPEGLTEDDICQWKFSLAFDPSTTEAQDLLGRIDEMAKPIKGANFAPYKKDKAKDENGDIVETGLVAINFTSGFPIHMIDCMKKECKVKIGWGSRVRVQFTTKPVNNKGKIGLGRYVRIIQVVDLKESGLDTSGFNEQEGFTTTASITKDPWLNEEENA